METLWGLARFIVVRCLFLVAPLRVRVAAAGLDGPDLGRRVAWSWPGGCCVRFRRTRVGRGGRSASSQPWGVMCAPARAGLWRTTTSRLRWREAAAAAEWKTWMVLP